ncbi:WXG100 family type VII secretion target [Frankia sp. AgB1.9]|uniref:WXG100 family type VII secretion target n=1 Tax=unclassified Frankia TaxID=2632575 RepID=UPI0019343101|nr:MULTISPECIES: WXG100 family type VII secretion target [unclassified Frankia]MBL7487206.1 WXG100 family type VII secretion target [Frankia sp. AgW1.1]MBL7547951.1 WXG100 family type VII secretion target [Frankia sp. AgB1.9]MBL7623925.1 WXG100 family type VII secretion target [Frankia sp. AgB1.8]
MANIQVDYEAIRSTATALSRAHTDMEGQLTTLKGLIDNLVTSGFITDQASGRFHEAYVSWDTGTRQAMSGLTGMSRFLTDAISQHEQLDVTLGQAAGG